MQLENLRIFAEVVRTGGFSRAAEHLNVSKGYVSQQVKQLEKTLKKQLLIRNTRNMRLTTSGEVVYQQAIKLTTFWQETAALLNEREDHLAGKVRCTAPVAVTNYLLSPWIQQILICHPEILLTIESGNTAHNLVQKDYDFAIRLTNTPPEDMVAQKLTDIRYLCCCSPAYKAAFGIPEHPAQLSDHATLTLSHWNKWSFTKASGSLNMTLQPRFSASDNELLKQYCLAGIGIGRFPDYMVQPNIANQQLHHLFADHQGETRGLYLIYPQMSHRPARVTLALDMLRSTFTGSVPQR